eukprot:Gb_31606 [translate_table: standard]
MRQGGRGGVEALGEVGEGEDGASQGRYNRVEATIEGQVEGMREATTAQRGVMLHIGDGEAILAGGVGPHATSGDQVGITHSRRKNPEALVSRIILCSTADTCKLKRVGKDDPQQTYAKWDKGEGSRVDPTEHRNGVGMEKATITMGRLEIIVTTKGVTVRKML